MRQRGSLNSYLCFPYHLSRDVPLEVKVHIIAVSKFPSELRPSYVEVTMVSGGRRVHVTPTRTQYALSHCTSTPTFYSMGSQNSYKGSVTKQKGSASGGGNANDIVARDVSAPVQIKKRRSLNSRGRDTHWNEWITLPVEYQHISRYARLVFTVWDESNPPRQIASSSMPIFTDKSTLKQGLQRLELNLTASARQTTRIARDPSLLLPGEDDHEATKTSEDTSASVNAGVLPAAPPTTAPPPAPSAAPDTPKEAMDVYEEMFVLDKRLEMLQRGWGLGSRGCSVSDTSMFVPSKVPALSSRHDNAWIHRLMLKRVDAIRRSQASGEGRDGLSRGYDQECASDRSVLVIELPHFNFPIVYSERPYPIAGSVARRLNDSWVEQTEPFTGRKYYKNLKNQTCHWTSPFARMRRLDEDAFHYNGDSDRRSAKSMGVRQSALLSEDVFSPSLDPTMPARWRRRVTVVFDPELDRENPIHTKYNKISRGVYDPLSKPNMEEFARIKQIINSPRRRNEIQESELSLLWQFRHTLTGEKKALVKFLYCVDWRYAHDVDQAIALLKRWESIDVDDALLLLSKDFTHDAGTKNALIYHVRRFAVNTLNATATDDDIISYLLQLVQALRYEPELRASYKGGASVAADHASPPAVSASPSGSSAVFDAASKSSSISNALSATKTADHDALRSPLAHFLISRAMRSPHLANYLHWYLFAECSAPTKDDAENAIFSRVHEAFIERLEGKTCMDIMRQTEMLKKLFKFGSENQRLGGNPDTKTKRMRRKLSSGGEFEDMVMFSESVPLPYNPAIRVSGVVPNSPKVFKSAMAPFTLTFTVDSDPLARESLSRNRAKSRPMSERLTDSIARLGQATKESFQSVAATLSDDAELLPDAGVVAAKKKSDRDSNQSREQCHRVMFKLGDDLRQDQLILQIITLMDNILKRVRLDLRLTPFRVMATGHLEGLVEFVPNSVPLRYVGNIRSFLQKHNPSKTSPMGISHAAMNNFVKSCAGYAVITYVLGIGDRHLDNILLKQNGQLFHIDFGYIFGRDPKWNAPVIRLTKSMLEAMGGPQSQNYRLFLELCAQAYNILRHHATLILNLLNLMVDANIEGVTKDDLFTVKDRFLLDRSDEEAERYLLQLLRNSVRGLDALWADILEFGHAMAN